MRSHVAVIGAGFAGLTAAYRLYQQGYHDIEIYEARGRVGGRIFSVCDGDSVIELGGQNIPDGGDAPHLRTLAKELGLSIWEDEVEISQLFYDVETKTSFDPLQLQKEIFPPEDHARLQSRIQELANQSQNMEEVFLALFPEKGPLYRCLVSKFAAYEGGVPARVSTEAWENLYYMLCGGMASVHTTPIIQRAQIEGGNSRLAIEIAKKLEKNIHYSSPLKAMGLTEKQKILLTFEGGQKEFDKVILAIPCPVYEDIDIDPQLIPQDRLSFIQQVPYGENAKIMVPLTWDTHLPNSVVIDGMLAFFSHATDRCTFYFSGQKGCTLKAHYKDYYAEALTVLKDVYPGIQLPSGAPQIPDDNVQLKSYEGPLTHFWVDDPYVKGSYSYRAPGMMQALNTIQKYKGENVRAPYSPIGDLIFFAGEHTAIDIDLGTMEGAIESGDRAARLIMAADQGN